MNRTHLPVGAAPARTGDDGSQTSEGTGSLRAARVPLVAFDFVFLSVEARGEGGGEIKPGGENKGTRPH